MIQEIVELMASTPVILPVDFARAGYISDDVRCYFSSKYKDTPLILFDLVAAPNNGIDRVLLVSLYQYRD